jgi:hypothetical protein
MFITKVESKQISYYYNVAHEPYEYSESYGEECKNTYAIKICFPKHNEWLK